MNVGQLVTYLDSSLAAAPWLEDLGVHDTQSGHARLVAMADHGITLDLLTEICEQLSLHLPTVGDPDLALSSLSRFVGASRNPLSFGSLIKEDVRALPILLQLFSASTTLGELLIDEPTSYDLVRLTEGRPVQREQLVGEIRGEVDNLTDARSVMASLRHFKRRETLRIAYGDIIKKHSSKLVAEQLTFLAGAVCEAAMEFARRNLSATRGDPRQRDGQPARVVQIGLQRFGGGELDYGTKLKSLFIYEGDGRTNAERPTDNSEFFDKLIASFIDLLGTQTELGCAYVVDIEKTPAHRVGRLSLTSSDTLAYFDTKGRTWERQALIKARPIAGDTSLGLEFLDANEPWVYHRYLNRADITGIKALKRRLERRTDRKGGDVLDVEGGVSDIELAVQFLQLINGDRREVRVGNTPQAIERLEQTGCITSDESQTLISNYDWLRRVEHRLEIMHGPKANELPSDRDALRKLAIRCGYEESNNDEVTTAFRKDYELRTAENKEVINRLLDETFTGDRADADLEADLVLDPNPSQDSIRQVLSRYGFRDTTDAYHSLSTLATEKIPFLSTRRCRHFLSRIAKRLLGSIAETPSPDATIANLCRVSDSIGGKGVLWELFDSHPPSLDLYVRLCSSSPYLISILTRYPGMIDELLDSLMLATLPTLGELQSTLDDLCGNVDDIGPVLHSFKNTQHLNVGVRELLGKANIRESTATLGDVAESCLQHVAQDQYRRLVRKYGQPRMDDNEQPCGFIVFAMGKFGGREPNYHSDVDVVFVFEEQGNTHHPPTIRGRETTTNQHFFSELGQRIVKTITEHSTNGRLYDSDPGLRPIEGSGPYAISLGEYRHHYLSGTHSFGKLRPLCQARPVYGSEPIRVRAAGVLQEILTSANAEDIDGESVRQERLKIQETAGPRNLKRGPGGIVDIEFVAQALQLRNAKKAPSILRTNTLSALESLRHNDFLDEQDTQCLCESYEFLRRVEARLRLLNTTARHDLPREADELAKLAYLLRFDGSAKLEAECARFTKQNRRLFEKLVG